MFYLRLFGGAALTGPGGIVGGRAGQKRQLSLLVLLATHDGPAATREKMAVLLWPEASSDRSRANLSDAIHALKKGLAADAIQSSRSHLALNREVVWNDVRAFRDALARGDASEALRLYAGPFLDGFHAGQSVEFERWVDQEREALRREAVSAAWELCESYRRNGRALEASFWATRARVIDPHSEEALRRQIRLLASLGDAAGVERVYVEFVKRLQEDLGIGPSEETRALRGTVLESGVPERRSDLPSGSAGSDRDASETVAVMSFDYLGREEDGRFFAEGMTEDVRTRLSRVRGVEVRTPGPTRGAAAAMGYRQLREALGATYVLEGSVRRDSSRFRISARLVDSKGGNQLWGESYDVDLSVSEIFKVQSDIANRIAAALERSLSPTPSTTPETTLEAYDYFLLGRHYGSSFTAEETLKSKECFEEAIALDPSFGPAYAGLARLYLVMGGAGRAATIQPHEAVRSAVAAATRALELGGGDSDAYTVLGLVSLFFENDRDEAGTHLRAAVTADPGSAQARYSLSYYLTSRGLHAEALEQAEEAVRLDPQDPAVRMTVGGIYYMARHFDDAIERCESALDLEPRQNVAWGYLGLSHAALGRFDRAKRALESGTALSGGRWEPFFGNVLARAGSMDDAQALLARYQADPTAPSFASAVVQAGLGLVDEAVSSLEKAAGEASQYRLNIPYLAVDPIWDPLESSRRFQELLNRLGLDGSSASGSP